MTCSRCVAHFLGAVLLLCVVQHTESLAVSRGGGVAVLRRLGVSDRRGLSDTFGQRASAKEDSAEEKEDGGAAEVDDELAELLKRVQGQLRQTDAELQLGRDERAAGTSAEQRGTSKAGTTTPPPTETVASR